VRGAPDVPRRTRPSGPLELTRDPRITGRVRRLALVSAVALGLIWWLAGATLEAPPAVGLFLAAGWILMPATLAWSR
jgi:hypothetical protein